MTTEPHSHLITETRPAAFAAGFGSSTNGTAAARREFEDYLECGLLEHCFLRVKCDRKLPCQVLISELGFFDKEVLVLAGSAISCPSNTLILRVG
jgi:hypothetical protein